MSQDPGTAAEVVTVTTSEAGVCLVRLVNPPVNALSPDALRGLMYAMDAAEDSGARALVVASGIDRFYAAGADIKTMAHAERSEFIAYGKTLRAVVDRLAGMQIPTVAAVEGHALGGGTELALACTQRVAGEAAKFSLPEVRIGMIPSAGATQRLPRLVGRGRALRMMFTGDPVDAVEASAVGMVDVVVAAGTAEKEAVAYGERLAAFSAAVLRDLIACVDASFDMPLPEGLAGEVARIEALFDGPDGREGMRAFLEKRPPRFN